MTLHHRKQAFLEDLERQVKLTTVDRWLFQQRAAATFKTQSLTVFSVVQGTTSLLADETEVISESHCLQSTARLWLQCCCNNGRWEQTDEINSTTTLFI